MNIEGIKGHQRQIKNLEFLLSIDKIPQAILFSGAQGIGKKLLAKRFLSALFCKNINPPCMSCSACKQIEHGTFPDFIEIIPNEKGIIPIGNEESPETGSIRWLIDKLSTKSISGRTGILIDGIDKITEEGQNSLLKTIEEPSPGTFFILITSNKNKLLPTILSRCTEIRYFPLADKDVKEIIFSKNHLDLSAEDSDLISSISGGSAGIAEIISDREIFNIIINFCEVISLSYNNKSIFEIDGILNQNKIKMDLLLDIIINIFRHNLLTLIKKSKSSNKYLQTIFLDDPEKVLNLLKILILLKKNELYNLNIKYAFKSLLYSASV